MLGLATAIRLAESGQRVKLFESAPEIGGLAAAWRMGQTEWDKFYHVVCLSDRSLRELLTKVGLEEEIRWVTTRTGFFTNGRLHSLSSSWDFLKFSPLTWFQKFRLASTILFASRIRGSKKLESTSVENWLRRLSGSATFEKIWLPLLKAKLGPAYQRTSAMFIWSYIDRMYKARRSGMKTEMFGYVPGGYRRILDSVKNHLQNLGVQLCTSTTVQQVSRSPEPMLSQGRLKIVSRSTSSIETSSANASPSAQEHYFDQVIMTLPNPIISKCCPELNTDEHHRLSSAEYLGVSCTSVLLDKPLAGFYVTNITDAGIPLTGIIEMGAIVPSQELGGNYLVYLPQYMNSDDPRFDWSDQQIQECCLEALSKIYADFSRERVRAIQTAKAKYVMTLPTLNYSDRVPPIVSSIAGLYLLNSAQVTSGCLNVNEVIEVAHRSLDRHILTSI